jgi:hypothetical protein
MLGVGGIAGLLVAPWRPLLDTWLHPFVLIGALGFAIRVGNGVDKILHKPAFELRPLWYVGEGDPSWKDPTKDKRAGTLSLTWFIAVMVACCVIFARYSFVLRALREDEQRYAQAYQAAIDLGATIQNRSVSFGGLTHVDDEDLVLLDDLMQWPLGRRRAPFRDLNLSQTAITNETLKRVANIKSLGSLILNDTEIDDEGLSHLVGQCPDLQSLFLNNTRATGNVLPLPQQVRGGTLRALRMSGCPIDDRGLKNIVQSTQEGRYLELNDTEIDDSMIDTLKLVGVLRLMIQRTNITKAGRNELRQSLRAISRDLLSWSPKHRVPLPSQHNE